MMSAEQFISNLVIDGITNDPWKLSTFQKEFILLSEFSELEGPKPIFTIPTNSSSSFNLNTFAVRIMSADCASIMQATDFSSFKIAGDIQVVLTELSEGAVAYVHHFVLYDICARGFVRPFCLAYITKDYNDLMTKFDRLLQFFTTVSSLCRFGNSLSFIEDLSLRYRHLEHLKNVTGNNSCDIFVENKLLSESQKKNITLKAIIEAMEQVKSLAFTFNDYLKGNDFEDHRKIFAEQYDDIIDKNVKNRYDDVSSVQCNLTTENCTCTDDGRERDNLVSVQLLSCSDISPSEYATSDTSFAEHNGDGDDEDGGILLNTRPTHQIPADVMSSILGKKYDKPLRTLKELCELTFLPCLNVMNYCLHVLSKSDIFMNDSHLVHDLKQLPDALILKLGCREFSILSSSNTLCCELSARDLDQVDSSHIETPRVRRQRSLKDISTNPGILTQSSSSFLAALKRTTLSSPIDAQTKPSSVSIGRLDSYVHVPSLKVNSKDSFIVLESPNSFQSMLGSCAHSDGSSDSYKDALESFSPISSKCSTPDLPSDKVMYSRSISVVSTESSCFIDLNNDSSVTRISLLSLRNKYSFLPHAVFTILIGRPLIVFADEKHARQAKNLIYGLGNFLPVCQSSSRKITPWTTNPIKFVDLGNTGLVGLSKVRTIPRSILQYVSVLDYEKQTLQAPEYSGNMLMEMFDTQKHFKSEKAYRSYIQQILCDLSNTVFVEFIKAYAGNEPNATSKHRRTERYFNSATSDSLILFELLSTFVGQIPNDITCEDKTEVENSKLNSSIKLNNLKCKTFTNKYIAKKR